MSKEKRIAIIKDALKHLPVTKTTTGRYVVGSCEISDPQEEIGVIRENCYVCMLGDLFLSAVGLYNGVNDDDLFNGNNHIDQLRIWDILDNTLIKYFDEYQLNLIEVAYEGKDVNEFFEDLYGWDDDGYIDSPDYIAAINFCESSEDKERMRAILENMLENDGEFKP